MTIPTILAVLMTLIAVAGAGVGSPPAGVARAAAAEIGPETNLCRAIRMLPLGEELVLRPGDYDGPCQIRRGGTAEMPLVIRAKDPGRPPRILYAGDSANVIDIYATYLVLRGLEFGPTRQDVDAVRIRMAGHVIVEDCRFVGVGGIAVVANHANVQGLVVRHNEIRQSRATAMYFGCHDGATCRVSDLVVEGNYIDGVTAPEEEVGYGLQVKLNSTAVVRDNVILDTKGPGIMIYGARALVDTSLVERNFITGSHRSSGIVIGGGPVIVRNNITVGNAEAGIGLEDYGRRNLLRGIVVAHNTVVGNKGGGILVPPGAREVTIANNAVAASSGTVAFPGAQGTVVSNGNANCSLVACFQDPVQWDFSPLALGPGIQFFAPWVPADDYFGRPRGPVPVVGAVDRSAQPIRPGFKMNAR